MKIKPLQDWLRKHFPTKEMEVLRGQQFAIEHLAQCEKDDFVIDASFPGKTAVIAGIEYLESCVSRSRDYNVYNAFDEGVEKAIADYRAVNRMPEL
jgi:hypothetical protein